MIRTKILPTVYAITFLGFIDTQMIVPIMALYASSLGASIAFVGLIIGVYSIVNTPTNIAFGSFIDRFGCKKLLILGFLSDSINMFLYTLTRNPLHLLYIRSFHGFAGGILGPATMYMVANYSQRTKEGRSMGFYGMAMGLAPLIGFMLSGTIIRLQLGFHYVFYAGSLLLIVGLALAIMLPKDGEGREIRRIENIRTKFLSVMKRGPIIASYVSVFSQWFVFGGITVLLPIYMKSLGMSAFHFSIVLIAVTSVFIALQYPFGILSDKIGRKLPSIVGLGFLSIGLCLMPMSRTFESLIVVGILWGLGIGSLFPSISALITDNTEKEERGTATGMFHALITSGVAVGAPVMGLVATWVNVSIAIPLTSLATITSIVVILRFVRT